MSEGKKENQQINEFDNWNFQKKEINDKNSTKTIKERDVVFLSIGENIGYEQNGKGDKFLRPVLIYKKFSHNLFLGIPLTSQKKKGIFYTEFSLKGKISIAILSQMRLFDSKRILYFAGRLGRDSFYEIKKKLIELLQ